MAKIEIKAVIVDSTATCPACGNAEAICTENTKTGEEIIDCAECGYLGEPKADTVDYELDYDNDDDKIEW